MKRTLTRILLAGYLLTLFPLTANAAGKISANDSIAGLGISVTLQGFSPSSSVSLVVRNPEGRQTNVIVQTDAEGDAIANVKGTATQRAGMYTIEAGSNGSATVAVLPETMDASISTVQSWTPYIDSDGRDAADISVTLRDKYGNILPGRPIALVSSRSKDMISALTPETGADGTQHFSLTTMMDGTIQVRAVDLLSGETLNSTATIKAGNTAMGGEPAFAAGSFDSNTGRRFYSQVGDGAPFDLIDAFEVTAPNVLPVGEEAPKVSIRAIDKAGNTVENYVGSVIFESTDPYATLPNFGGYTFKDRDLGFKSFPLVLTFKTPGPQLFRVKDANNEAIKGTATINVGGDAVHSAAGITVTSHKDGDNVNTLNITVAGVGPKFANLIVMGGEQDAQGQTDADGKFAIPVTLSAGQRDFTIRVQDDTRQNDSGQIHLILDQTAPTVGTITFAPTQPDAGQKTLVVVTSEPKLKEVTMTIKDPSSNVNITLPLLENTSGTGSYQAFFDAPATGVYQPAIKATDKAGNATEVRATFTVGLGGLTKVMNLKAEPRVNAVALEWDAVKESVDGYRIYVGESATNFLYTLDTGRATTKATVAGLAAGKTYYFAVTALRDALESKEKSDTIQAQALGITLTVEPGDSSLHVKWTTLSSDLPLSGLLLEYGIAENAYTESRMINGELKDYTIRDLLNGVRYSMRITPITVTGDKLTDLAAKGEGTPNGSGFHAGASDPIPGNLGTTPGGVKPAPTNVGSGLPQTVWMAAVALGLVGALYSWHRRKSARHTDAFLQAIQAQYRR